eukprot:CAMPEP_0113838788 /NCGR_PEP_ID=MMETSP0328-20130328/10729_1 /TAXON_ID=39455 /ORGANISM="Alexandrium minutum" /LENGTH=247 /DNA_ID=CAMNT_0000807351 /DNA_START=216 /DNA_END=959 /DNA_ORIENTATION=+ /assembly_acc=CAM_ASM_000350
MSFAQLMASFVIGFAIARFWGVPVDSLWGQMLTSASVVVGLASQNTLSNVAAGAQLVFARPFEVGDFIQVGGFSGTVTDIDFFHVRITTLLNEGVNIPNSTAVGGALVNYSENYDFSISGLRSEMIDLRISVSADLEQAIGALEKAAKKADEHIAKLISDETPRKFPNGTHTLKGYYKTKYGRDLTEDQKASPCYVFVGGQDKGYYLALGIYYVQPIRSEVKPWAFRTAVKCLKEVGIDLYEPPHGS